MADSVENTTHIQNDTGTTSLLIDNAVMKSAEAIRREFNEAFDKQHSKTETLVLKLHEQYKTDVDVALKTADEAKTIAKAALKIVEEVNQTVSNIWSKIFVICGAVTTIATAAAVVVTQLTK